MVVNFSEVNLLEFDFEQLAGDETVPIIQRVEKLTRFGRVVEERCDALINTLKNQTSLLREENRATKRWDDLIRLMQQLRTDLVSNEESYEEKWNALTGMIGHATGQRSTAMDNFVKLQEEHQTIVGTARAFIDLSKKVLSVLSPLLESLDA